MSKFITNNKALPFQITFLIFSMLLNCMGIIILKFSEENVSYGGLGVLEAFKDLPIALVSIFFVNVINKMGTKKTLLISITSIFLACLALPFFEKFWFFKVWFAIIGISFAMAKISVFSIIRSNVTTETEISSVMSKVEASFMIGVFLVNILFGWLLMSRFAADWRFGFWLIALIALINFFMVYFSPYSNGSSEEKVYFSFRLHTILSKKAMLLLVIIFFVVFLEQGFNSWLPTFYRNTLDVNSFFALEASAFMALFSFIGRLVTSKLIVKISWYRYIGFCLVSIILLLMVTQAVMDVLPKNSFLLYVFPTLGIFIAPLYPLYNSKLMMCFDQSKANLLVSFIVIVSSLGSSFGSLWMSLIFQNGLEEYFAAFAAITPTIIGIFTIVLLKSDFNKDTIH